MNSITADSVLRESLGKLSHLTEIRDAQGNVIGYYTPASRDASAVYAEAAAHFDPHEMTRRKQSNDRRFTTSEVLEHLDSLENR